jgi:hypothetical protein
MSQVVGDDLNVDGVVGIAHAQSKSGVLGISEGALGAGVTGLSFISHGVHGENGTGANNSPSSGLDYGANPMAASACTAPALQITVSTATA